MEAIILDQISDAEPDEVEELNLEGWKGSSISIQDKKLLERYTNLDYLSLADCGLKTLENFPLLLKLIKLDLNNNSLKDGLESLSGLKDLMQLNLSSNEFRSIDLFSPLSGLNSLVYLEVEDCPVSKTEDYRQKLFELIPSLQIVDGLDKNGKEASLLTDEEGSDDAFEEFDDSDEFGNSDEQDSPEDDSDSEDEPKRFNKPPNKNNLPSKKK